MVDARRIGRHYITPGGGAERERLACMRLLLLLLCRCEGGERDLKNKNEKFHSIPYSYFFKYILNIFHLLSIKKYIIIFSKGVKIKYIYGIYLNIF